MSEVRLIDANALKEAIEEYRSLNCVCTSTIIGVRNVMYLIDNAPTVEPEDLERTGYWETPEPDYARDGTRLPIRVAICSECQKPNKLPVGRYCSECGSRNKE